MDYSYYYLLLPLADSLVSQSSMRIRSASFFLWSLRDVKKFRSFSTPWKSAICIKARHTGDEGCWLVGVFFFVYKIVVWS